MANECTHHVVVNHEDQYSLWPIGKAMPDGWRNAGFSGSQDACVEWVERHWTDMTPRSLRSSVAAEARFIDRHEDA